MKSRYLIIDEGNSRAKISILSLEGNIEDSYIVSDIEINFLSNIFNKYRVEKSIYCSVREKQREITDFLDERSKLYIDFNYTTNIPITNDYSTPHTLGMDRLAAAIGAATIFPKEDILIVDFGSAITVDFVEKGDVYRGGNISPGASLRFKSLNQFTNKLPLCTLNESKSRLCSNETQSAIESGIVRGIIYEIDGYINIYRENNRDINIIFTGGDAKYFGNKFKIPIFVNCEIVASGLYQVLKYNDV